jgi:DNA topoisomerase 2-associated protein PAT1
MVPLPRGHVRGSSYTGPLITNPQQILQLSEEDRAAFLQDDALRAKRNHKIHLLARYNGLMTPQDKYFISRIQLQQLVTATGTADAEGPEALLNEDFYYQVYAQIRGASRQNPHQPASQFAQTYLFQTGGRFMNRRNARGGDGHLQRMEQQVQRAVEAARANPKNRELVIEGSLGKIRFNNSKAPRPLLDLKRNEELKPNMAAKRQIRHHDSALERRTTLRNIENVYSALMEMEDHVRQIPAVTGGQQAEWAAEESRLNAKLWGALKANEGFVPKYVTTISWLLD